MGLKDWAAKKAIEKVRKNIFGSVGKILAAIAEDPSNESNVNKAQEDLYSSVFVFGGPVTWQESWMAMTFPVLGVLREQTIAAHGDDQGNKLFMLVALATYQVYHYGATKRGEDASMIIPEQFRDDFTDRDLFRYRGSVKWG